MGYWSRGFSEASEPSRATGRIEEEEEEEEEVEEEEREEEVEEEGKKEEEQSGRRSRQPRAQPRATLSKSAPSPTPALQSAPAKRPRLFYSRA